MEPIERPYCYLLLVTIGGGVFGRQIMWNDPIVTCYLLPLGVVNLGEQTCVPTLLLLVTIGVVFLSEQTCVPTLLLVVSC